MLNEKLSTAWESRIYRHKTRQRRDSWQRLTSVILWIHSGTECDSQPPYVDLPRLAAARNGSTALQCATSSRDICSAFVELLITTPPSWCPARADRCSVRRRLMELHLTTHAIEGRFWVQGTARTSEQSVFFAVVSCSRSTDVDDVKQRNGWKVHDVF